MTQKIEKAPIIKTEQSLVDKICHLYGKRPIGCTGLSFSHFYKVHTYKTMFSLKKRYFIVECFTTEAIGSEYREVATWANGLVEFKNKEDLEQMIAYIYSHFKKTESKNRRYIELENNDHYSNSLFNEYLLKNKIKEFVGTGI